MPVTWYFITSFDSGTVQEEVDSYHTRVLVQSKLIQLFAILIVCAKNSYASPLPFLDTFNIWVSQINILTMIPWWKWFFIFSCLVYSLKECCLQTLRPIVPAHYMENLELPRTLITELKNSLKRNRFLSTVVRF